MNKETRQWISGIMLLAICSYNVSMLLSIIRDGVFDFSSIIYIIWAFVTGLFGIHYFIKGIE